MSWSVASEISCPANLLGLAEATMKPSVALDSLRTGDETRCEIQALFA